MKELAEYRTNLIERLASCGRRLPCRVSRSRRSVCAFGRRRWNVHQVAVHTRDVDKLVYGLRARRTAVEDNPEFPNFDGDAYMAATL